MTAEEAALVADRPAEAGQPAGGGSASGGTSIDIYARGHEGGEQFRVLVDGVDSGSVYTTDTAQELFTVNSSDAGRSGSRNSVHQR